MRNTNGGGMKLWTLEKLAALINKQVEELFKDVDFSVPRGVGKYTPGCSCSCDCGDCDKKACGCSK